MIHPDQLAGDAIELTEKLKHHVAYDLGRDRFAVFEP